MLDWGSGLYIRSTKLLYGKIKFAEENKKWNGVSFYAIALQIRQFGKLVNGKVSWAILLVFNSKGIQ